MRNEKGMVMRNNSGLIPFVLGILLFVMCSNSYSGLFDLTPSNYEIGFQQTFGGNPSIPPEPKALIKTKDGGYAFTGTSAGLPAPENSGRSSAFWLVKTDPHGKLQWQRTFGTSGTHTGSDDAYSLVQTPDEGYLLVGDSSSQEFNGLEEMHAIEKRGGGAVGWIVKFAKDGRMLWHKSYGTFQRGSSNHIYRIAAVEGGYVLAGSTTVTLTNQPTPSGRDGVNCLWLQKIDEEGNVQWEKIFKDVNAPISYVNYSHLLVDESGNFVLALSSSTIEPDSDRLQHLEQLGFARSAKNMLVFGFNKLGNKTSHAVLTEPALGNINLTTTQDGYLVSGYKQENKSMWFAWLDKSLALKEHKVVDTQGLSLTSLIPTNDGNFYGAGSMSSGSEHKAIVGRLGKEGQIMDTTSSGLNSKWMITDVAAGADDHRFVTLWQAYSQKRAVLIEVIRKPSKER